MENEKKKWGAGKITLTVIGGLIALSAVNGFLTGVSQGVADKVVESQVEGPSTQTPVEEPATPIETPNQENARLTAESYLNTMAFSRKGLIEQLEFEGYAKEDAEYAVGAVEVDWNEQAALSAASYLDTMPFSKQGLIDQLEYEGFTKSQAKYGVSTTGLK
jgi:hypothetical protein